MFRPIPLLLAGVWMAGLAVAEPRSDLHAAIRLALQTDADAATLVQLAARLFPGTDHVSVPERHPPAATAPGKVRVGEIQAALTQLAILAGGNGQVALQLAQGGRTDVIDLMSGSARLEDLAAAGDLLRRDGTVWHLSRPLIIWPGASLTLTTGEELEVDSASGAFLISFGDIALVGATLRGDAGKNATLPDYRPFLLVTGQGSLLADGAVFEDLGFGTATAFRGVSVLATGLMRPALPSAVIDSQFSGVSSLTFTGPRGLVVTNSQFAKARGAALAVDEGQDVILAGNRITSTGAGPGIRMTGSLQQARVLANVVEDGGKNGIQIDGMASGLVVAGNVVTGNAGTGISIGEATCVAVQGNILAENGTTGLRLAATGGARVAHNAILFNGSAGIELQRQEGLAPVLLSDNILGGNRDGLHAAGLGEVRLAGNSLADQLPRQFAGDFAPWLAPYLTAEEVLVIPAAADSPPVGPVRCLAE